MEAVLEYPAVILISRGPTERDKRPFVCFDGKLLYCDRDVQERLWAFARIDRLSGLHYTYTVRPRATAEQDAAAIRAELEPVTTPQVAELVQNEAGSACDTPAPEAPKDPTTPQDTTKAAGRQVELVISYDTDQARERPRMAGGELVALKVDGKPAKPPTQDLNELYRLLQARGYTPAGFEWMGRAVGGKRQRRQVYAQAVS